jgi:hypothetical protein
VDPKACAAVFPRDERETRLPSMIQDGSIGFDVKLTVRLVVSISAPVIKTSKCKDPIELKLLVGRHTSE